MNGSSLLQEIIIDTQKTRLRLLEKIDKIKAEIKKPVWDREQSLNSLGGLLAECYVKLLKIEDSLKASQLTAAKYFSK